MNRVSSKKLLAGVVLLVSLVSSAALAAVKRETALQSVAQVDGTFSVYDYSSGVTTISDTATQWDTGTYVDTEKTPDGHSVVLRRKGDVAPNPAHAWWDTLWRTRRCWTVTNATAATVTNGRAILSFDSSADIANGWMLGSGADLRVTTGGAAPVPLVFNAAGPFPSAASALTAVVPSLAAAASETICIYWGNSAATSASVVLPVNAGGPIYRLASNIAVPDALLNWSSDGAPLPVGVTRVLSFGQSTSVQTSTPVFSAAEFAASVPVGTPPAIFTNHTRGQQSAVGDFVEFRFAVATGTQVEVRTFHSDHTSTNHRFNATVNGSTFLPADFNPMGICIAAGKPNRCGVMHSGTATAVTGSVNLQFTRGTFGGGGPRRPMWSALEIRTIVVPVNLGVSGGDRREGLLPANGTWTSSAVDTTSAATIYGTVRSFLLGTNIAVGKPVVSTLVATGSVAVGGNDGRRTGTAFISNTVVDPFWEVDLGSSQPIRNVDAFTTAWAMSNVTVFVSPTSLGSYVSPAAAVAAGIPNVSFPGSVASANMNSVFPSGTTGRYVRIWGSGAGLINLSEVEVSAPVPSEITVQVAAAPTNAGPWNFVGPDNTAATSYVDVGAFPYAFDSNRYYRVQARLASPGGISSPVLNELRTNADLTVLPRSADGFHQFKAAEEGVNWMVRIKTPLPNITTLATATLHAQNVSSWGSSQISGFLDRSATNCCTGNAPFFSTSGATTSQTPVALVDVGGFRNLSVINQRADDIPANHDQIVDIQLAPLVRVQVPLRRTETSSSTPANIALGKVASQSSTGFGGIAARGNDNNTNGDYFGGSSVMHTLSEVRPWWQVNLGSQRLVNSVEVYNRIDCCASRLTGFWIVVSANPLPATYSAAVLTAPGVSYQTYTGGAFVAPQTLTFPGGAIGQYVRLWSQNTDYLHVAEVRVIGPN
jgi:F5/8 type C domain